MQNLCLFLLCRYDGDGGTHDVHHSVSDDCEHWAQRLEATDVGLRMVFCVSVFEFKPPQKCASALGHTGLKTVKHFNAAAAGVKSNFGEMFLTSLRH